MNKRKWILLVVGVFVIAPICFIAYLFLTDPGWRTTAPEFSGLKRTVLDNTLSSPDSPSMLMTFDQQFKYIGGQKFILYGTADVEQHFFVEEHPDGKLKSFFWVQFEAFLPDNDYTYDYSSSPMRLQIGDFNFFTDAEPGMTSRFFRLGRPGTDGYLARKFAADKGYKMPDNYAYARLVHIPDEANRKEMLIIFMEDLAPTGWTGDALRAGGEHEDRWPEVQAAHLDKIKQMMKLSRPQ